MKIAALLIGIIPSILQFVENLIGPKNGELKKEAAVQIAQSAVTVAADQGLVPQEEADNISLIAEHVQAVFDRTPPTPAAKPATPGILS